MQTFDAIRHSLLEEARRSPDLLSDLAGLEQYVAESYNARSFIELLQNADDAQAVQFLIMRSGNNLLIANDGRPFTPEDFQALCRSAASTKTRGESIGYRGIGFKSVVGLAEIVYLFSNSLEAVFSKERTKQEILGVQQVPLIRVPHELSNEERDELAFDINYLKEQGYTTVFGFKSLTASSIESEFAAFEATSLMFLRHIRQVELRTQAKDVITLHREAVDSDWEELRLTKSQGTSRWSLHTQSDISIAFGHDEKGITPLAPSEAVVHAFLPTHEPTGLGIKINGDFSTDPSRTRIVFDERTAACIERIAELILSLLEKGLGNKTDETSSEVVKALAPLDDPGTAMFKRRSFATELIAAIKRVSDGRLNRLKLRPKWLNALDFDNLAEVAGFTFLGRELDDVHHVQSLFRFLGAKETGFEELVSCVSGCALSPIGNAEVASQLVKLNSFGQLKSSDATIMSLSLWIDDMGTAISLQQIKNGGQRLQQQFVDSVTEKVGNARELERFLTMNLGVEVTRDIYGSSTKVNSSKISVVPNINSDLNSASDTRALRHVVSSSDKRTLSLTRWRGAEQQVAELFEKRGYSVKDVSRQNIGYDIEAVSPSGQQQFLEVKSLNNFGQTFTLTTNEEAVARLQGNQYVLVLVCQEVDTLRIAYISNPAQTLKLERQCRQWVWECSNYEVVAETVGLL